MQMQAEAMQHSPAGYHNPFKRMRAPRHSEAPSCFRKGSYVELSTGSMRRVEDIRTEDFIQSAVRSQLFKLKEATVVKIDRSAAQQIIITFSYDTQHSKVNMEVTPQHPLFVYGQGWASCNPQLSFELFELKCQQLQVGDICLSLVQREAQPVHHAPAPRNPSSWSPPGPPAGHVNNGGAMPANAMRHPYQVYAEMANLVAAYTQQMIDKMRN